MLALGHWWCLQLTIPMLRASVDTPHELARKMHVQGLSMYFARKTLLPEWNQWMYELLYVTNGNVSDDFFSRPEVQSTDVHDHRDDRFP